MSKSRFEVLIILVVLGCGYVSYRLCREGYALLRLATVPYERRIARVLVLLGYMLGGLVVLAAACIAAAWL